MYHAYPSRRKSGVILPFLVLIIICLTGVLVFQIWSYYRGAAEQKTENKAALTIANGSADVKLYGEEKWIHAVTGTLLREGDSLRTYPDSRISLALLNSSFVRAGGSSEFTIDSLRSYEGQDAIIIKLAAGDIWLKKTKTEAVKTEFSVVTDDFRVRSAGTVFSVNKRSDFRVHVVEGRVTVDVTEKVDSRERIIENFDVGVGQEAIVTDEGLQAFRQRKNPDVIHALSDSFEADAWYLWNTQADASPELVALTVREAVSQEKPIAFTESRSAQPAVTEASFILPAPEIIEPDTNSRKIKVDKVLIKGTTDERTKKIIVKTFVAGKEDSYTLQRYEPGKTAWTYIASEALANLVPGENRYGIIAEDKDGKRSEPAELVLFYEKELAPADLSAPAAVSFNGGASNETTEDSVKVEGKIGKGIVKILVNDFALTRYVPDSGTWLYYAKTEYDNLKEGENDYTVFGMDALGKKTPVTKFTIKKMPKVEVVE